MIRRRFLGLLTLAGATGVGALSKAARSAGQQKDVTFKVTGFTCVTCATGLETLLGREKGVLSVTATYPEGLAKVHFNERETTVQHIAALIEGMGFRVQAESPSAG